MDVPEQGYLSTRTGTGFLRGNAFMRHSACHVRKREIPLFSPCLGSQREVNISEHWDADQC